MYRYAVRVFVEVYVGAYVYRYAVRVLGVMCVMGVCV